MNNIEDYEFRFLSFADLSQKTLDEILALFYQLSPSNPRNFDLRQLDQLIKKGVRVMTARYEGQIVGMGTISPILRLGINVCEINDVIVDSEHRRLGISKKILQNLILDAINHYGATQINLTSNPNRTEANNLYQKLGFQKRKTNSYRMYL